MFNVIALVNDICGRDSFFLCVEFLSLFCKFFLLFCLVAYDFDEPIAKKFFWLLVLILVTALLPDISWILILIQRINFMLLDDKYIVFFGRLGCLGFIIENQLIMLFLTNLLTREFQIKKQHVFFLFLTSCLSFSWLYFAICRFNIDTHTDPFSFYEQILYQLSMVVVITLFLSVAWHVLTTSRTTSLPNILRKQLNTLFFSLILPYGILELISNKLFMGVVLVKVGIDSNTMISISTLLTLYAVFFARRKVIGVPFLNFKAHVPADYQFNFIDDFKIILEQLSQVTALQELGHITQNFFRFAFGIPHMQTRFYVRKQIPKESSGQKELFDRTTVADKVEQFIAEECGTGSFAGQYMRKIKMLIKDEIDFTNFYREHNDRTSILNFLEDIKADVFLPIFDRDAIVAYIIIESGARPRQFYSSIEQDEMLVFTSYLSTVISILKHGSIDRFLKEEKELREKLYYRHQEIHIHKESIRSFLQATQERKIGIVLYKARRFTYANQVARELIEIDLNLHGADQLTQAFKQLARDIQHFKCSQIRTARDHNNGVLILSGLPGREHNSVIILLYRPEISDILKQRIERLNNPLSWDYLLYLETTQAGEIIKRFLPCDGSVLLNFKIELLQVALSKKALLLEVHEDDQIAVVELLHKISMRQGLHTLKLVTAEKNSDAGIKLFGINPLFESDEKTIALLERLHNGTLFIKNVHLLSIETQNKLADYLTYGYYHPIKSSRKLFSKARIICSSTQNIQTLATEISFSKALYAVLKDNKLLVPSLVTLDAQELVMLADGFAEQLSKAQQHKNIVQLMQQDKDKILEQRPASIQELKDKVYQLMLQKTVKLPLSHGEQADPAYDFNDTELMQAIRLGKKALQDPEIMQLLWNKFRNQAKIALVLGVNKSSVNRRFKEYDLIEN